MNRTKILVWGMSIVGCSRVGGCGIADMEIDRHCPIVGCIILLVSLRIGTQFRNAV